MRTAHQVCGCDNVSHAKAHPQTTDAVIEATPDELGAIKAQLTTIENILGVIFGDAYNRTPESLRARRDAADMVERHLAGLVEQWALASEAIFAGNHREQEKLHAAEHAPASDNGGNGTEPHAKAEPGDTQATAGNEALAMRKSPRSVSLREDFRNALLRFAAHLRDPEDLTTYVYLRRHCQQGMLSRATPSQFNTIHIALKQVILNHVVRAAMRSRRMDLVRDAVVAAVDERRLMVGQFYIESREAALRISEEKYRASIDHAPDPMYEIEPGTWKVVGANAAAIELHVAIDAPMLGETAAHHELTPVGYRLSQLVPPEMAPLTLKHLENVMQNGSDEALDLPLGGLFFDVNSALIPYGNRQFIQMILHDVTQRRAMLDELLKAERLAAAGTFAAGVAHEVNNPLASISSLVQSLLSGESDPGRRMSLHTILSQITRISGTLKDLVNFARPANAHRKAISLNDLVTDTLRLVTYNKRFRGITLEPVLAPDLEPAFVDGNEIQQVLLNLLFNAADAIPHEGGMIRVSTGNRQARNGAARGEQVVMRVTDNGIGIPKEHLARVFDPFFTTKPAGAGVGLGLSLCQRIVLGNQGKIRLESEVGKGTTVTILLPVYQQEVHQQLADSR